MVSTVAFCMLAVAYVLWKDMDSEVAETAVSMAFLVIASTVSSYVFGAVWQDKRTENDPVVNTDPGSRCD